MHKVEADWGGVEADFRAGTLSLAALARKHGPSASTIRRRAVREGWQRGRPVKRKRSRGAARGGVARPFSARAEGGSPAGKPGGGDPREATAVRLHRLVRRLVARIEELLTGGGLAAGRDGIVPLLNALAHAMKTVTALERAIIRDAQGAAREAACSASAAGMRGQDELWEELQQHFARVAAETGCGRPH